MDSKHSVSKANTKSARELQLEQEREQVQAYVYMFLGEATGNKFKDMGYTGRIGAWWNKKVVIYTAKGKDGNKARKPVINGVLTVRSVSLNFAEGLSVTCDYTRSNASVERIVLNHVPNQIDGLEVYMWVPHFSELHWVIEPGPGKDEVNRLKFALAFKARSDWPWFNRNNAFAMELKQFKQTFPDFADTVL